MPLVIRDETTGESRTFLPSAQGYADADAYRQTITEKGHRVGDDSSGTLAKVDSYFKNTGNYGRSGSPSSWF